MNFKVSYTLVSGIRGRWKELRDSSGQLVATDLSARDVQLVEAGRRMGEESVGGPKQGYSDLTRIRKRGGAS